MPEASSSGSTASGSPKQWGNPKRACGATEMDPMATATEPLHSDLSIRLSQKSEAGRKPENQDTVGARIPDPGQLATKGIAIAIADGVSTSAAARLASQTAVTGFLTDYYATPDTWRTQQSALQVIESLNRYLWGQSRNSVQSEGYLTTFTVLILKGQTAFVFHVGDTRVYHVRDGCLEQLTRDHSQHIDRQTVYLSRALGADPHVEVDMHTLELQSGDQFVLTSDGVHDAFTPHAWQHLVKRLAWDPDTLVATALEEALHHGSEDNLSIQVVSVDALGTLSQTDAVTALRQLPFPPLLKVGNVLDGYQVKKILHESTRSQLYLVESPQKRALVLKTPSVNFEDDPGYIERFAMEAWIGTRVQNPHVARVVELQKARSHLYYLTEHVPGPTLTQVIRERAPLPIPDALELIEQLIKGTRAFHRRDTLHQDLKPDNVIVSSKGAVIVDFGSCWVAGLQELAAPFVRETQLGTMDYAAPEYRLGGPASARSDQFSLAVLLYEMLTGHLPFGEGYRTAQTGGALQRLRYTAASQHNPLVPVWLDMALEKALSFTPQDRYSSLSEWLLDLQRPNPSWRQRPSLPLAERNPVRFWQGMALAGWLAVGLILWWKA